MQDSLRANGYTYHYVGGNYIFLGADGYNSFNSGFWGVRTTELPYGGNFITGYADWKGLQPDLILMEIGTNDIQNSSTTAAADLGKLMDKIWLDVPNAIILASTIPPFIASDVANNTRTNAYNLQVPGIVSAKASAGKKAMVVDVHSAITTDAKYFYDHVHPNDLGHRQIAAKWFSAIRDITVKTGDYQANANLAPVVRATVTPTFTSSEIGFRHPISINPALMKVINLGESAHLTGTLIDAGASTATGVSYAWSMSTGSGTVSFTTPNQLNTDATFSGAGQYGLCLTATRNGLVGKAYCRVVVKKQPEAMILHKEHMVNLSVLI